MFQSFQGYGYSFLKCVFSLKCWLPQKNCHCVKFQKQDLFLHVSTQEPTVSNVSTQEPTVTRHCFQCFYTRANCYQTLFPMFLHKSQLLPDIVSNVSTQEPTVTRHCFQCFYTKKEGCLLRKQPFHIMIDYSLETQPIVTSGKWGMKRYGLTVNPAPETTHE